MESYPGIEQTDVFRALQRVMETRQRNTVRNEFAYPTGERRWFDLVIDPVPDGICVLSLDVTDYKLADDEIQRQRLRVFQATMQNRPGHRID